MTPAQRPAQDGNPLFRLKPLCALVLSSLAAWQSEALAEAAAPATRQVAQVEFDSGFLATGSSRRVDLSRFERGNVVLPGTYNIDMYVNGNRVSRTDVPFRALGADDSDAQACFDAGLLQKAGVDLRKLAPGMATRLAASGECLPITEVIPGASASFDFGDQRLELGIPQVSLSRSARGSVSPELLDSGVTTGILGYQFNVYSFKGHGSNGVQTQGYLGLNAGFNAGDWHFRHNGSYNWSGSGHSDYQNISTYVQRDLLKLASQLTLGEAYTSGELFDSTAFRGVRLATDDRMLPDSLRGYAPTVRGVATSNARVTIRQAGMTIYETTVAPGAFEIDDLYATGYGGDLNVTVTEADGTVRSFSVPYAAVPLSLRPGVNRYSVVAGAVRDAQNSKNPLFVQGTWQRGLNNLVTGYGGVTLAQGYASAMLGGAFNTPVGAVGADVTQAHTSVSGVGTFNGTSTRLSYSKSVLQTGTDLSIAAYRYSTGGYFGLNEAMRARAQADQGHTIDSVWRQRNRASVTLGQRLGERGGRLNVTASTANYWNRDGSDINYSVGYNNVYKNISFGVSATRQRGADGRMGTMYFASVTIPLGKQNPLTLTGNVSRNSNGSMQAQTTLSGSAGADNELSYSLSANHTSGAGQSSTDGGANVLYRSPYADLNASVSGGSDYQQAAIGVRGAAVLHRGGVTLSQPLSDTFAIVEAPNAEGARVTNASGVRIDSRGYAVVPYLTPYSMNTVSLDPKGLSTDVELRETSQQVAPRAGSVPMLKFETVSGRSAMIRARRSNDMALPFGAAVHDEGGQEVGVVGQASKIFARGLQDKGELKVTWGNDEASACRIAYELPERKKAGKGSGYQQIEAICAPVTNVTTGLPQAPGMSMQRSPSPGPVHIGPGL
ncbi:fimbria/pilus outer membrane usher protein [Cupriavidus sp. 2TAF22]|uniref:fimbria/pilus outer membrane usher protein n=1 Tax=unclassified Cupriavidus TaxID=2640874 RepID=UPI003F93ABF7